MSESVLTSIEVCQASGKQWGVITLNQEKSLNSLTFEMIQIVSKTLRDWHNNDSIVGVTLQGAGEKSFCAGGDIRMLYTAMKSAPKGEVLDGASQFFQSEYSLDYMIHTYSKPILCLGHGIVMGGGLGLMAGASHRVLSERSTVAMPEISIGLYPDVGASWFLNRMPGRVGLYLGLTGTRLKASDCLFVGLGDHYIERSHHSSIMSLIHDTLWVDSKNYKINHAMLSKLLKSLSSPAPESELRKHFDAIQELTHHESVSEIWRAFENYSGTDEWILAGKKTLLVGSPTSAAVLCEQLKRSKHLSLADCFRMELNMSNQFAARSDFPEGVRALLIDKDQNPKWSPSSLGLITDEWVDGHFKPYKNSVLNLH